MSKFGSLVFYKKKALKTENKVLKFLKKVFPFPRFS